MNDQAILQSLRNLTLERIADRRGNPIDGGVHAYLDAEVTRRIARAQIDAARWMKWSVVAIAVTSGMTAVGAVAGWLWPHPFAH
jgi:hypothetical protein